MSVYNFIAMMLLGVHFASCNLIIDDVQPCDGAPNNVTYKVVGEKNGIQIINADLIFPVPVGNDDLATLTIYIQRNNTLVPLLTSPQKLGACISVNSYLGNIWHDIQRLNGVSPKTCPIVGTFHLHHYELDTRQIRIPLTLGGRGKLKATTVHKKTKKLSSCMLFTGLMN